MHYTPANGVYLPFLYQEVLGGNWLQDSVTHGAIPSLAVIPTRLPVHLARPEPIWYRRDREPSLPRSEPGVWLGLPLYAPLEGSGDL